VQQLRYGLDNPASKTARESIYLPLVLHVQTGTGAHLASNLKDTGGSPAECNVDSSPPSSAQVKREWRLILCPCSPVRWPG
jgi:hypothetical protein